MSSYAQPPTLSSGIIALLAIGGTLDVVIIAVVVYVVLRRRERNLQELKDLEAGRQAKRQQSRQSMARRAASIKRRVMEWRDVPGSHTSSSGNSRKSNASDASRANRGGHAPAKDGYDSDSDTSDLLPPPVPALPSPKVWASPFSSSEDPVELPTTRDDRNDFAPGELTLQRPASAALPSPVLSTAPSLPDFGEYRAHDAGSSRKTLTSRGSTASSTGGAYRWTWRTQSSGLGHALGMRGDGAMPAAWQSARTSHATTRQPSQKTVSSKKWSLLS